ncbi:type III secretion system translocon subunit SctB [Hahella aquimaris]|uniref:type III secretion system translocon subunit SctB n=1 Tax=Hahella sp. HNIBRBA332 TaxID=3015983 RepID=UPI00273A991E|nr:type III secretion system translocon subunit SctB [Hahella sp. HNIBRBA332]WLQ16267.1 type III secretion system translocon subunit SctB [Hahella sp. HNIBRBA332]
MSIQNIGIEPSAQAPLYSAHGAPTSATRTAQTPALTASRQQSAETPFPPAARLLDEPSIVESEFDAGALSFKLNGTNHGADTFKIMEAIHKIFIEMRRQAAESRQDAYLSQWTALEAKAEEIKSAARKDLAASVVNGAMSMAGGALGMYGGARAISQTNKAMKLDIAKPKIDAPAPPKTLELEMPTPAVKPPTPGNTGPTATTASKGNAGQTPPAANAAPVNKTPANGSAQNGQSKPAVETEAPIKPVNADAEKAPDTSSANKAKDQADASKGKNDGPDGSAKSTEVRHKELMSDAQNYSSIGMVVGQFFTGFGGLIAAPLSYSAELDRAEKEQQDAQATKAQADVESEVEFVRAASEGAKAIQDFLDQFIASRAQVNSKIMA